MGRPRLTICPGEKHNHLTAIEFSHITEKGHQMWVCECDCEKHTRLVIKASDLLNGHRTNCGCEKIKGYHRTHGMCYSRLYTIHQHIKERCNKPTSKAYSMYGGKGIKICREWQDSFEAFAKWSIENGYADDLTIDRIDNSKGYSPDNCRWTNWKTQQNNKTNNHRITFNGEIHTLAEWGEITGIGQDNLFYRIKKGWGIERALTESVKRKEMAI